MATTASSSILAPSASSVPAGSCNNTVVNFADNRPACGINSASAPVVSLMRSCCGPAPIVVYNNNCGLYCLATNQTVAGLEKCLLLSPLGFSTVCNRLGANASTTVTDVLSTSTATTSSGGSGSGSGSNSGSGASKSPGASTGAAARSMNPMSFEKHVAAGVWATIGLLAAASFATVLI